MYGNECQLCMPLNKLFCMNGPVEAEIRPETNHQLLFPYHLRIIAILCFACVRGRKRECVRA